MDAASDVRQSALETLAEIEPVDLATRLQDIVNEASMLPGVITLMTADAIGGPSAVSRARRRAVGVQLCYEGLRLTRDMIRQEDRYASDDPTESYMSLIAGEVMVARGFSELAETAVAKQAIEIVQRFSRNQTHVYNGKDGDLRSLEYDVVVLAVSAGATVIQDVMPPGLAVQAERLAADLDREPLPPALGETERIRAGVTTAVSGEDPVVLND